MGIIGFIKDSLKYSEESASGVFTSSTSICLPDMTLSFTSVCADIPVTITDSIAMIHFLFIYLTAKILPFPETTKTLSQKTCIVLKIFVYLQQY
jgi:hypothetical protein